MREPIDVRCNSCKALPGQPCKKRQQKNFPFHKRRIDKALCVERYSSEWSAKISAGLKTAWAHCNNGFATRSEKRDEKTIAEKRRVTIDKKHRTLLASARPKGFGEQFTPLLPTIKPILCSKFIIYALCDPRTGEVRYIGKSSDGLRRPESHAKPGVLRREKSHVKNWIKSLVVLGLRPQIEIVEEHVSNETLNEAERFYIVYFRFLGFRLTNQTEGGEGAPGVVRTEEEKANISSKLKTYWKTEEGQATRTRITAAVTGKKRAKEATEKTAAGNRGQQRTEAQRLTIALAHGARPFTDQYGNRYLSQAQAARALGFDASYIGMVLRGRQQSAKGYTFTYEDGAN